MSLAEIAVPRVPYLEVAADLPVVLVVEDERKLRWSLIEQFRAMGIEALTASSGYEAIRVAGESRPDLILLDGLLPEMHGFEIARFIRRIDADYRPHIAIMTAIYKHTRYQNEARLKYGIDDYLIKPVLPHSLAGLVRRVQAGAL
ncbi:MAG TPA: response regulator [Thermoanaerobaculia bacterium]|jgi:DNA-binding response OmpR family regulator|nr:response regulator [Thermoanaerobaculia bacterium]